MFEAGWCCPKGHVMGEVYRDSSNLRLLRVYREAILPGMELCQVLGEVRGGSISVRCSICGKERVWAPGQEFIDKLMARHKLQDGG